MTDRTLPNGRVVRGVPDNYTNEQLKSYAIANGLATEEDYNKDIKTNADYLSLIGEFGGATAGAIYGASVGSSIPVLGTIIGGGMGAGLGYFAGEIAESYVEDRDFDLEQETANAIKTGATDALFSTGFGIVGKGLSAVYKPLRNIFQPVYVKGGTESEVADIALAIKRGETTLEEVASRSDISQEQIKLISENIGKRQEELERVSKLHTKLQERGTGLLPTQAVPEYRTGEFAQDYASSSYFLGRNYDNILEEQDNYITAQFSELLGRAAKDKTREETGIALTRLVNDSDKALQAVVDPLYKAIDKEGAIFVGTGNVKNAVKRTYDKLLSKTKAQQSVMKVVSNIPERLSPAEVVKQKRKLAQIYPNVKQDPVARQMVNSAVKNLNNTLKGKKFVRPISTIKLGQEALNELTTKTGEAGITGAHKTLANKLVNLRDSMSFSEAHKELSNLKALQRDMQKSVGEKSTKAEALINKAIGSLEESMETTAKNFNPELKKKYDAVKTMYREGVNTIHGDWIVKALRKDNVADIGQYLVKSGENIGVKEVKALIAKAKELKVNNAGDNLLESIEKEFINNLFPQKNANEGLSFMRRMNEGKFADTFNAIVGKQKGQKLLDLGREIELMSKGIKGSETALSLSIRSGEISQIRRPSVLGVLGYGLLGWAAKKGLDPKRINKQINELKVINSKLSKGEPIPQGLLNNMMNNLGQTAAMTGLGVGALVTEN